ncbi:hypothetical protein SBV1_10028 [Verrucomicrobia bacterium]|nr:hypothetical protein SBV1_10028 [Verrucomicrobiota bacterium]
MPPAASGRSEVECSHCRELYLHFPLIQSALRQKMEAKPLGWSRRERSQDRAAVRGCG